MQTVFHYSEAPNIELFAPRKHQARPDEDARVWAIDALHAPLYFFPRDCPRAAFWTLKDSSPNDVRELLGQTDARFVLALEWAWLAKLQTTTLYEYEIPIETFTPLNPPGSPEDHGVWISGETVTPLTIRPVGDLLARFAQRPDVELRFVPSLWPLYDRLLASSLHFSFIRFAHALPRPKSSAAFEKETTTVL